MNKIFSNKIHKLPTLHVKAKCEAFEVVGPISVEVGQRCEVPCWVEQGRSTADWAVITRLHPIGKITIGTQRLPIKHHHSTYLSFVCIFSNYCSINNNNIMGSWVTIKNPAKWGQFLVFTCNQPALMSGIGIVHRI